MTRDCWALVALPINAAPPATNMLLKKVLLFMTGFRRLETNYLSVIAFEDGTCVRTHVNEGEMVGKGSDNLLE